MRRVPSILLILWLLSLSRCIAFMDTDSGAPPPEIPPHPQFSQ
jgi:hypothetical protein